MLQYNNLLKDILENGVDSSDRTGTGTKSVFGRMIRFDLNEGFPAVTTKRLAWKAVVGELLWFLEGSTDERRLAELTFGKDREALIGKRTIWTDNADAQGLALGYMNNDMVKELGPVYGSVWRHTHSNNYYPVKMRVGRNIPLEFEEEKPVATSEEKLVNKFGEEFIVISKRGGRYDIQFINSGFIKKNVRLPKNGCSLTDGFKRTVYKTGMLGYYEKKKATPLDKRLRDVWECMISRCYNPKDKSYQRNVNDGVIVCDRWHRLDYFIADAKTLSGFHAFVHNKGVVLEKDYYGTNIYSPDTVVFVNIDDNRKSRKDSKPVVWSDGKSTQYFPSVNFARKHFGISQNIIKHLAEKEINGFSYYKTEGYVIRRPLPVDQLTDLIDGIKSDPYSRRHMLFAWENSVKHHVALNPCHFSVQFYVRDNKLSCMWNQRSVDAFLGLPFNIASYALLTHMIARECGFGVGELIGSLGDTHIYNNHINQVEEQLTRDPYDLPKLVIDSSFHLMSRLRTGFDFGDSGLFTLKDYQHHPALSAPMAI